LENGLEINCEIHEPHEKKTKRNDDSFRVLHVFRGFNSLIKRIALNAPTFPESKLTMKRHRIFILAAVLLLLSLPARSESLSAIFTNIAPAATTAIPRRANIIFIQADSLGYGDLSCYGQEKFSTPNLDKLAAGGIRFTNYYAADSASSPARAALLLGQDSGRLKQRAELDVPLTAEETTVAQLLKQSGYHTCLIGEWNLGDDTTTGAPWKKGFNEFAGYFNAADAENYYADYIWHYASRSALNSASNQTGYFAGKEMLYPNTGGNQGQYLPDLYTKAAMNFIVNNKPDAFNRYQPFFLLVNYATPRANAVQARQTGNGLQVPTDAPFSGEAWPQPEKNKAAMIARLDGDIGKLVEQLQKAGQASNTVVFFSSAGIAKAGGGVDPNFFSSNIASNDLRVPMIVSWPGNIRAGRVSKLRWSAPDFAPTALQIAYVKPVASFTGISILPALRGEPGTNAPALPDRPDGP
jgi:arylsulfatase A-like enzyme